MTENGDSGDEVARIFQEQQKLALEEVRAWIEALPEEERDRPHRMVGDRTFTPIQTLRAIEEATDYGRIFVEELAAQRLEASKREEEIDAERRRLED